MNHNCLNICNNCNQCRVDFKDNRYINGFIDYLHDFNYKLISQKDTYHFDLIHEYCPSSYYSYDHFYKWCICQHATVLIDEKFITYGYNKFFKHVNNEFKKKHFKLYISNVCPYYLEHYMTKCSYKKDNKQIYLEVL